MKGWHAQRFAEATPEAVGFRVGRETVELRTERPVQLVDVTELVSERVRRSGVLAGLVNVQVLHTTASVFVNENEPLLLQDFASLLDRLAPCGAPYRHDALDERFPSPPPGEPLNGHAHCRALLLGFSAMLNVAEGRIELGPWQRVFLAEFDGPRPRTLSIHVLGAGR